MIRYVMIFALLASSASAQDIAGERLAAFVPDSLARVPRSAFNTYSVFVTALYGSAATDDFVVLQIHSVVGAGAEAHSRATCPRYERIGGFEACVQPRDGRVTLVWVFEDRVQVHLGARDEATAVRLARQLDLRGIRRLALEASVDEPDRD